MGGSRHRGVPRSGGGVRPRLAAFSACWRACARRRCRLARRGRLRGWSRGRGKGAAHAVAREDDAHEDARKYYPLRALILYEEAQALGVVPKFRLGADSERDSEYDIRGFPPAAAEVAVLTLLRVFRRYSDAHAGEEEVTELPSVTLRVLSDAEMEAKRLGRRPAAGAHGRSRRRFVAAPEVQLRRVARARTHRAERERHLAVAQGEADTTSGRSARHGAPACGRRADGPGDAHSRARARRRRRLWVFAAAIAWRPRLWFGSGPGGLFRRDDQRYSADDDDGGYGFMRRKKRSWSRGGRERQPRRRRWRLHDERALAHHGERGVAEPRRCVRRRGGVLRLMMRRARGE